MARNVPWALIKKELQRWAFLLLLFVLWLVRLQEENLVLGAYRGRCLLGHRGLPVRPAAIEGMPNGTP